MEFFRFCDIIFYPPPPTWIPVQWRSLLSRAPQLSGSVVVLSNLDNENMNMYKVDSN